MSDSPQGPNWWKATDGRWYPPELFTGPPELRPGAQDGPSTPTEPSTPQQPADEPEPEDQAPPGTRRPPVVVVVGVVAALLLLVAGAWWLLGGDDSAEDDEAANGGSTSTGPVSIVGTLKVDSSVAIGEIAPNNCDEWSQLLRVEIQTPSGTPITAFAPTPVEPAEADRSEGGATLSCELDYGAQVPADSGYVVVVRNVRDPGRPPYSEPLDGAEEGEVEVRDLAMTYTCDPTNGCVLRPAG